MEHVYHLSGKQIETEEWDGNLLVYLYDAEGSPIGMQYRNDTMPANSFYTFWFEKNLQGDVVAVYNSSGTKCVSYVYDAWGNVIAAPVNTSETNSYATYNPFRYRGYYFDTETCLYYLNSRYYDPAIGRFINADGQLNDGLLGNNQFAYCENDPVNNTDHFGTMYSRDVGTENNTGPILGAILVINYEVPVVGHSSLYYKNESGQWYYTEFNGNPVQEAIAIGESLFILHETIKYYPIVRHRLLNFVGITVATVTNDIKKNLDPNKLINSTNSKIEYIPLYGDYSYVYELAQSCCGERLYSLLYKNCGTYIGWLLQKSDDPRIRHAALFSNIPSVLGKRVKEAVQ